MFQQRQAQCFNQGLYIHTHIPSLKQQGKASLSTILFQGQTVCFTELYLVVDVGGFLF